MSGHDEISRRQLYASAYIALLSPMIHLLPRAPLELAGRVSWVSPVIAAAFGMAWLALLRALFASRRAGEGLLEIAGRCLGRPAANAAAVVSALWIIFCCGFMLRTGAERLLSAVYDNGNIPVFIIVPLAAASLVAMGNVKSLARCGEIFAIVITLTMAVICLLSVGNIRTEYLLPLTYRDLPDIALGALPMAEIMSGCAYAAYLYRYVPEKSAPASPRRWMLAHTVLAAAIMVVTVGVCSAPLAKRLQTPFFVTIRSITALGFIERIESVVVGIWVAADFLLYGFALIIVSDIAKQVTHAPQRRPFVLPAAALAGACAFLVSDNAFDLIPFSDIIVPAVNFFTVFGGVAVLYIVGKLRRKI